MRRRGAPGIAALRGGAVAVLLTLSTHAMLAGQGVRGSAVSTARYIEIRPITQDSVARTQVTELPDGTFEYQGRRVFCVPELDCVFYRPLDRENAVAFVQDMDFTAWGLGVSGLSVTAALRGRAEVSGEFVWPRSEDHFDAILAYAEWDREPIRVRLGRQRTTGGLGFYGFDGLSVLVERATRWAVEAYGGRSLARGLYEPRNEALRGLEDFVPDRDAYLIGGWGEVEPVDGTVLSLRYQREIWSDRSALLSERASADLRSDLLAPVAMSAGADYDFAFGNIGKAHVTARLPIGRFSLEATGRRYVPYFELWTIWGFFSPVGYNEAELAATWDVRAGLSAWGTASRRRYEDADAAVVLTKLEDQSTRLTAGARWLAAGSLAVTAEYTMERGFGAFLSSADASARWQPTKRVGVTLAGTAFQQIEEFRVGEGYVIGGSAGMDVEVTDRIGLSASFSLYRQTYDGRPSSADWNQRRAFVALRLGFGGDPGMRARVGG